MLRRMLSSVIGAALVAIGLCGVAAPASADINCTIMVSKTSTSTTASMGTCQMAQARIDRYAGGVATTYKGPLDVKSYVYNASGTNAGNYARGWLYSVYSAWYIV